MSTVFEDPQYEALVQENIRLKKALGLLNEQSPYPYPTQEPRKAGYYAERLQDTSLPSEDRAYLKQQMQTDFKEHGEDFFRSPKQTREPKNWAYYQDLRRKDVRKYFGAEVQRQLLEDRQALGKEAFYGEGV